MNNKKGFTLVELLTVVLIIGVLASIALPSYMRSVEKSRATEAMNMVRSINEAVYAYAAERNKCPERFTKLSINVPGAPTDSSGTTVSTNYFSYQLNAATNARIPGTDCGGVVAERRDGSYKIWNPYAVIDQSTKKRTLACIGANAKANEICKTLGIYTSEFAPF